MIKIYKDLTINQEGSKSFSSGSIEALDVAEAIGIFLVILGHVTQNDFARTLIYSFHMPLFFFLSGLTANFNKENFVLRKFQTLMIPYFIWAFVFLLYWIFIERRVRGSEGVDILTPIKGAIFGLGKGDFLIFNVVLWFLPSLFCVECLAYFVNKRFPLDKRPVQIFVLIAFHLLSWGITRYTNKLSFPFCIETAFIAMPFYLVGIYFKDYVMSFLKNTKLIVLFCIFAISLTLMFLAPGNMADIRAGVVGNYFLFYTKALLGTICVLSISPFLQKNLLILAIGKSTLVLMIFHDPLKRIMIKVAAVLSHIPVNELRESIPANVIITIIIISLIMPVKFVIEKYFPQSLGKAKPSAKLSHA
ncbi:MAG: acyltransferase family protein [Mucilaginibacter sp.]|nr:acyltransferase family protein [Mucilaginibacter sp.]